MKVRESVLHFCRIYIYTHTYIYIYIYFFLYHDHLDAKGLQDNLFPYYRDVAIVFGKDWANGKRA